MCRPGGLHTPEAYFEALGFGLSGVTAETPPDVAAPVTVPIDVLPMAAVPAPAAALAIHAPIAADDDATATRVVLVPDDTLTALVPITWPAGLNTSTAYRPVSRPLKRYSPDAELRVEPTSTPVESVRTCTA